jgi:hypothetical protein
MECIPRADGRQIQLAMSAASMCVSSEATGLNSALILSRPAARLADKSVTPEIRSSSLSLSMRLLQALATASSAGQGPVARLWL